MMGDTPGTNPDDSMDLDFDLEPPEDDLTVDPDESAVDQSDELKARLERMNQAEQALGTLLGDPEVQKVIQARNQGLDVSVNFGSDTDTVEDDPLFDTSDLDEDDPTRQLLQRIESSLGGVLDKKLGTLSERLGELESLASSAKNQEAAKAIKAARERFSDFDQYSQDTAQILRKNQDLSIDEAYILAKTRKGKLKIPSESTHSEKPTSRPAPRGDKKQRVEKATRGKDPNLSRKQQLNQLIADSLENQVLDLE
jgi:hypothetical protein